MILSAHSGSWEKRTGDRYCNTTAVEIVGDIVCTQRGWEKRTGDRDCNTTAVEIVGDIVCTQRQLGEENRR